MLLLSLLMVFVLDTSAVSRGEEYSRSRPLLTSLAPFISVLFGKWWSLWMKMQHFNYSSFLSWKLSRDKSCDCNWKYHCKASKLLPLKLKSYSFTTIRLHLEKSCLSFKEGSIMATNNLWELVRFTPLIFLHVHKKCINCKLDWLWPGITSTNFGTQLRHLTREYRWWVLLQSLKQYGHLWMARQILGGLNSSLGWISLDINSGRDNAPKVRLSGRLACSCSYSSCRGFRWSHPPSSHPWLGATLQKYSAFTEVDCWISEWVKEEKFLPTSALQVELGAPRFRDVCQSLSEAFPSTDWCFSKH